MFSNVKLQFPTSSEFRLEESYLMIRISKNSISVFKYKLLMKHVIFQGTKITYLLLVFLKYLPCPDTDTLKLNSV